MKEDTGQILIVDKIVNNNIVIAKDFRGREVVAIGKGVGFRKRKNEAVHRSEIMKTWNIKSIESKPRFFNRYGSGAFIPEFYRYDGSRRSSDNDETSGLFNNIRKYVASGNFLGNTGSLS